VVLGVRRELLSLLAGEPVISSCLAVIGVSMGWRSMLLGYVSYDLTDKALVNERVAQFRDQTRRFLAGELSDDEFRHLRLRNGLYIQTHAPMLRVAIPYGLLSARQLRTLGHIARHYDHGYGHFTTRQNIQYNWPSSKKFRYSGGTRRRRNACDPDQRQLHPQHHLGPPRGRDPQ